MFVMFLELVYWKKKEGFEMKNGEIERRRSAENPSKDYRQNIARSQVNRRTLGIQKRDI